MPVMPQLRTALADRYLIEREIGSGGMATVYLARDVKHNRKVALKVLDPELGAVLGAERFLSEIQITANLQHPHLLPLFDSGDAGDPRDGAGGRLLFYVMPYVDGESLRARLQREHQLPVDDAIAIATAVADALDYAHRHGVVHRDLKPENILLHEGTPLVADFGIALAVSNAGGNRITQTGLSVGTPQYMSPEQATGERRVDGRSDIYSLSAVLYEMLTGEAPHVGATSQAVIARVLTERPRRVRTTRDTVPLHVDAAIDRALSKLPADRFSTAHAFGEALAGRVALPDATSEVAETIARSRAHEPRRWVARLAWPVVAIAAVAVAAWAWVSAIRAPAPATVRFALNLQPSDAAWQMTRGKPLGVSADGQVIAYVTGEGSQQRLAVRSLATTHARILPSTEGPTDPTFSPDGRWIAFGAGGKLKKVAVEGGPVTTIAELREPIFGVDWGPGDMIVVGELGRLAIVSATSGAVQRLDTAMVEHRTNQYWPHFSPDGQWLVFTEYRGSAADARVVAMSIATRRRSPLALPGIAALGFVDDILIYASNSGDLMAAGFDARRGDTTDAAIALGDSAVRGPAALVKASVSRSGSLLFMTGASARQVVALDVQTGNVRQLVKETRPYTFPRLSPDGRRIALTLEPAGESQVSIYDFVSQTLSRLSAPGIIGTRPEWTPDGRRVLFRGDPGGGPRLLWQPADGSSGAEPVFKRTTLDVENVWEAVVSPDGRTIAYRTGTTGSSRVWTVPLDASSVPTSLTDARAAAWAARFSPDGRWLAYSADYGDGRQVYIQPVTGSGPRVQVSDEAAADVPVWASNGRTLYYVVDGERIVGAALAWGTTPTVVDRKTVIQGSFYFGTGHATYDVMPNGRELVLLKPVGGDAEMVYAYNWAEEVRRRVAAARRSSRR